MRELDISSILELMDLSPLHQTYSVDDFERLIISSLEIEQYKVWFDENTQQPIAFATWAWLNKEAEMAFLTRSRKLHPLDFKRTNKDDQLWVIEIVAPFNNIRQTIKDIRIILSPLTNSYVCFVRRNVDGSIKRLGYIKPIKGKNEKFFN